MLSAVIDLTVLVPMAMQRLDRSLVFQRWTARAFEWVISPKLLGEFRQVTDRPRLARWVRSSARDALLEALQTRALVVTPTSDFLHCRDPKDDVVIATAVAAQAHFIVTADGDLLDDDELVKRLKDEHGISVVHVYEFLEELGKATA